MNQINLQNGINPNSPLVRHATVSHKYQFVLIEIEKVATRSFVRYFKTMHNNIYQADRVRYLDFPPVLQNYRKLAFIRNPIERLIAVYKVIIWNATPHLCEMYLDVHGLKSQMPFADFASYVCDSKDEDCDIHWIPQYWFLKGILNPLIIGHFDNLNYNLKMALDQYNIPYFDDFPKENQTIKLMHPANPYPDIKISDSTMIKLKKRYAMDLKLIEKMVEWKN